MSGYTTFSVSHPIKQNNGVKMWASRKQSRCYEWERMAEMTSWDQNCTKPSTLDQEVVYWFIIPRNNGSFFVCLPLCVCSCVQMSVYLGMCVEFRCQPWVDLKPSSLFWETFFTCLFFVVFFTGAWGSPNQPSWLPRKLQGSFCLMSLRLQKCTITLIFFFPLITLEI